MNGRNNNNPWNKNNGTKKLNLSQNVGTSKQQLEEKVDLKKITEKKFKDAYNKHVEAAKKHIENYESSSDEEELAGNDILKCVFKNYDGDKKDLVKTQEFLENTFQCGTAICLICIGSVKRTDSIWSCKNCYNFYHLQCLQRWANDTISQKQMHQDGEQGYYNNLGEYILPKQKNTVFWDCPKCRHKYSKDEIPHHYECFCQKERNPEYHPWILPHSCSQKCEKLLQPRCGHKCVLLCHPGFCPPCPQVISVSCKCNQSNPKMIRCSQNTWTCLQKCQQKLSCGIHKCGLPCHSKEECPPCKKRSQQKCLCGNKTEEKNCTQTKWRCNKICGKQFSCGIHTCEVKCHASDCGECPLGKPRSCPCGKQISVAPCTEQIESCGDTCNKVLPCGIHRCLERCHKGDCSQCMEIIEKKCRCGLTSKELRCSKQFTCEIKCKQIRECKKHACNRKCCDNQCPSCDKICGQNISCGKHKCKSLCHTGLCYPCTLKSQVKCRCGNTSLSVLCGRERKTKPPKCMLPCKIPPKCHHDNPHRCHLDDCPICVQMCGLKNDVTNCEHPCQSRCHDAVKVLITDKNFKAAGPWELRQEIYEERKLPHPQCAIKVPVSCLGGHEIYNWPCYNSKPTSCTRLCNRQLKCGNHTCERICHKVNNLESVNEEESCAPCERGCNISRPKGCTHPCKRACHPKPCLLCTVNIKSFCHCGLTQTNYKCADFYKEGSTEEDLKKIAEAKEKVLSCGDRCIKNYNCGHRCTSICHSGRCPNSELCKKKVKVSCPCKTRKVEIPCDKIRAGNNIVKCDVLCESKKQEQKEIMDKKALELEKIQMEKNRIELELFDKKFGKKKYKERKQDLIEEKPDKTWMYMVGGAGSVIIISLLIYFFILN